MYMYILYLYTLFINPYIRKSKWSKVIFVTHNGQISQKEHGLNIYVICNYEKVCSLRYHQYAFVATHTLGYIM